MASSLATPVVSLPEGGAVDQGDEEEASIDTMPTSQEVVISGAGTPLPGSVPGLSGGWGRHFM